MSFALVFGCSPSTGVTAATRFMYDISQALLDGCTQEMTCTFPDVLESLQGSDNNFEMVTSSTLKPLRMFYGHNVVRILRGYIFIQEGLEGFGDWEGTELSGQFSKRIGEPLSAKELGSKVRENLMDPSSTNIPEVELLINKTKAEIVQIFRDIRELGNKIRREQGTSLGAFVVSITFLLRDLTQLKQLGAPLEDKSYTHDYSITQQGELVCFP